MKASESMASLLDNLSYIIPNWNIPANIKALVTTRVGGYSKNPFDSFNLAEHVDDDINCVRKNRDKLTQILPSEPIWLNQVHSNSVVTANASHINTDADGSLATKANTVSVVMTADCLPVLICNRQGTAVSALHAGWRGLLNGILEQGAQKLCEATSCSMTDLLVWFGPAIGPQAFEVGDEVRQAFLQKVLEQSSSHQDIEQCFKPALTSPRQAEKKWFADIYQLARVRLSLLGVENFSGGNYCTYNDRELFYSYRRDGKTGRMASLIWIDK